jgi:hypothetical protein
MGISFFAEIENWPANPNCAPRGSRHRSATSGAQHTPHPIRYPLLQSGIVQAVSILFGTILTAAACYALGGRLLGRDFTDPGARFVIGAAIFSLAIFALCATAMAYPLAILAICAAVLWIGRRDLWRVESPGRFPYWRILLAVSAIYCVAYFFNAMAPEWSFDGSAYHLSLVARYLRQHSFGHVTWDFYADFSEGAEMVFLPAFAFGQHSAAAMVHFAFLLALAWQVFTYARSIGSPFAGACGVLLVFCSPLMGVDGTSAYVDVAAAAAAFTLFHLLQVWGTSRAPRLLWMIGIAAGFCYAVKYTAWTAVPYALALVLWKSRRWRDAVKVALPASALIAPWMLKNWIVVGNPLAPLFNRYFPNPHVTPAFEASLVSPFALYSLTSRWQIPMEITTFGRLGGLFGPVFLLAPLALLALRRREGRQLLLAALVFGAGYFSNISVRFLIPSAVFVALALALVLAWEPRVALAVVLVHAFISWPTRLPWYAAPSAWRLSKVPWRQALRIKPPDEYLRPTLLFYDVVRMIDRSTPPDATVFSYRTLPEAYTSRRILVGYKSEENQIDRLMLQAAYNPDLAPVWQLRFPFPRQSLTAIRLVQQATTEDQWIVHEVRLYDGPTLLSSHAGWHFDAHPTPWTASAAFDGLAITPWRCGETMRPGQFIEAGFPAPLEADSVVAVTAHIQWSAKMRVEGRDAAGVWKPLCDTPTASDAPFTASLRMDAARELRRRGIGYLLAFEDEADTLDLRQHPDLYGVREVAHNRGAQLFQILAAN